MSFEIMTKRTRLDPAPMAAFNRPERQSSLRSCLRQVSDQSAHAPLLQSARNRRPVTRSLLVGTEQDSVVAPFRVPKLNLDLPRKTSPPGIGCFLACRKRIG